MEKRRKGKIPKSLEKFEDNRKRNKRKGEEGSAYEGNDDKKRKNSGKIKVDEVPFTSCQFSTMGIQLPEHEAAKKTSHEELQSGDASVASNKLTIEFISSKALKWNTLLGENLECKYCMLMTKLQADELLKWCESHIEYNSKAMSQVRIMGKWIDIPRKQVAMGDDGLSYRFSGQTVFAKTWHPVIRQIRDRLIQETGSPFNFVLINRYKDGNDHIGEHQDDEKELVEGTPIASLTLGQGRDFVFKHKDSRGKKATRQIAPVVLNLQHGMLLLMNHPTNKYWYHSLPKRKNCPGVRVNMTFRVFHEQNK